MQLTEPPRLQPPTVAVRESWLAAERAHVAETGASVSLLDRGLTDFGGLVAERQGTLTMWAVPTTIYWYVSGEHYLGELVIRHELTPTSGSLEDAYLALTGESVEYRTRAVPTDGAPLEEVVA